MLHFSTLFSITNPMPMKQSRCLATRLNSCSTRNTKQSQIDRPSRAIAKSYTSAFQLLPHYLLKSILVGFGENVPNLNCLTRFFAVAALVVLCNPDTAGAQTLTVTPNPVNFNVQIGVTPLSQNVNITNNGASVNVLSVSASTTTGQNWLLPSVGSSSVFVSIQPAGLTAGTYSGTVTANTSSGTVTFPVNLTVAAAPTVNVSPSGLNFAFQTGTTAPLAQTISITSSGAAANVTVTSSGAQW